MALTKVTGQVINTSTDVTVGVLTVTNTLAVGGTVSVGGTLTYEDVTNIDSVGLITARNGIVVGSGITLSKDGDVFATGVTTATTFVGALTGNVTGNISGGTVAGSTGTFTGDVDIADKIIHTGDTDTAIRFPAANQITFETSGSEQLRINSLGILKGPTTGRAQFFHSVVNPVVQIEGAGDFDRQVSLTSSSSTAAFGSVFILGRQRSGGVGGNTVLQADDSIGLLSFQGNDGTNFIEGSRIESNVETGVGANDMPSNLRFFTNSGTTTLTERLRITSGGYIKVPGDQGNSDYWGKIYNRSDGFSFHAADGSVTRNITFYIGASTSTERLRIGSNGTSAFTGTVTATGTIESTGTGAGVGGKFGQISVGAGAVYNTIQNTVADTPIHLQYNNTGDIKCNEGGGDLRTNDIIPHTNNSANLGSNTRRWANIHTNDLNLSNEGSKNDVDGTWGQYTIQEGQSDLFLINRRSGKRYKFLLQEVD